MCPLAARRGRTVDGSGAAATEGATPVPYSNHRSDPPSRSGRFLGLLVPAAEPWPCQVLTVDTDALGGFGGDSVEEIFTGAVSDGLYAVHGRGAEPQLPDNAR